MRGFRDVERHFGIVERDEQKREDKNVIPRFIGEDSEADRRRREAPREIGEDYFVLPEAPAEIGYRH
ncbi:hypothetical protein [Dialister hominis]|jgi:hypothetical protein|uniref:hypothetical protein n=1 Tax=Dialister hominis TaxID=2582419 RepID=UPI003FEF0339